MAIDKCIPLSRRRAGVVYGLLGVILIGHSVCIMLDRDIWPFSCYAMYSYGATSSWDETRMYGVPQGEDHEFPLDEKQLVLSRIVLRTTLQRAQRQGDLALQKTAAEAFRMYELRRIAGRHAGPSLQALRVYALHWDYEPEARNRLKPDRHVLLMEVRR